MTATSITEALTEATTEAAEALTEAEATATEVLAEAATEAAEATGDDARRKALAEYLTEAWTLGNGANVWKARAARAWCDLYPSPRSDVPYVAATAAKSAEALGILGCKARQFANYAKAGEALRVAGFASLRSAPTEAEIDLVAEALDVARKGNGTRKAAKASTAHEGNGGPAPTGTAVTTTEATEAEGPKVTEAEAEERLTEAREAESWAAEVLSTLARYARNATVVTTTAEEREAIAEAAAHLVARLEAEAEARPATAKAGDAAARNVAEAEAAKAAKAEAEAKAKAEAEAPKPQPRRKAAAKAA